MSEDDKKKLMVALGPEWARVRGKSALRFDNEFEIEPKQDDDGTPYIHKDGDDIMLTSEATIVFVRSSETVDQIVDRIAYASLMYGDNITVVIRDERPDLAGLKLAILGPPYPVFHKAELHGLHVVRGPDTSDGTPITLSNAVLRTEIKIPNVMQELEEMFEKLREDMDQVIVPRPKQTKHKIEPKKFFVPNHIINRRKKRK